MMPFVARSLALSVLLLGSASLVAPGTLRAQDVNGAWGESLRLRPGDAVRLEVRDEPELTGDYAIDRDGRVLLPILGLVQVAGQPFDDVRHDLLEAYAKELADPATRIRLTPVLRIAVLGEVTSPGLVAIDPTFTLADVIASAGGLTPSADRRSVSLVRDGRPVLTTSMEEVGQVSIPILSGDQVLVGRRSWIQENAPILVGGGVSIVATLITALLLR